MLEAEQGVTFDVSEGALRSVALGPSQQKVAKVTRRILNRAKVLTPVDTGLLRSSLHARVRVTAFGVEGTVETNVSYAEFVHDGTAPHVIRAHGKALKFTVGGRTLYRREVFHPGTNKRPFLRRAMIEVAPTEGFAVASPATL